MTISQALVSRHSHLFVSLVPSSHSRHEETDINPVAVVGRRLSASPLSSSTVYYLDRAAGWQVELLQFYSYIHTSIAMSTSSSCPVILWRWRQQRYFFFLLWQQLHKQQRLFLLLILILAITITESTTNTTTQKESPLGRRDDLPTHHNHHDHQPTPTPPDEGPRAAQKTSPQALLARRPRIRDQDPPRHAGHGRGQTRACASLG